MSQSSAVAHVKAGEMQSGVLDRLVSAGEGHGAQPVARQLEALRAFLADDLGEVEAALDAMAGQRGDLAEKAAAHLLRRPGKRIRPIAVLLAARLGHSPQPEAARGLAVAAELIHAATLLHDDVIDGGEERRGAPAAWVVYGNTASVLGGDHLLVEALRRVATCAGPQALLETLEMIARVVEAEALQLQGRGRFEPRRETYLRVARGKTAALFEWGLRSGGLAGGLGREAADNLGLAGASLGLAFQLVDDLLDIHGEAAETGKSALTDLKEGKLTWPFIIACERDPQMAEVLRAALEGGAPEGAEAAAIIARLEATGAGEATRQAAIAQGEQALAALRRLPECPAREALEAVVRASVHRRC